MLVPLPTVCGPCLRRLRVDHADCFSFDGDVAVSHAVLREQGLELAIGILNVLGVAKSKFSNVTTVRVPAFVVDGDAKNTIHGLHLEIPLRSSEDSFDSCSVFFASACNELIIDVRGDGDVGTGGIR